MMNWQFNWYGWSFKVAIVACIIHLATAIIAGYQGSNKYEEEEENPLHFFLSLDVYTICMIMKELMKN